MTQLLLFALGILLGPGLGILNGQDVTAATPFIALSCGVAGAALAARLDARALSAPALATGVLGASAVAAPLVFLLHLRPAVAAALGTAGSALLTLAALAAAPRSVLAPVLLAAAIALSPARRPPFGIGLWVLQFVLAAAVGALVFRALGSRPTAAQPPAAALTALLVGAGVGTATGASPLPVGWGMALALGAASPARSDLRCLVLDAERSAVAPLWFAAGVIASVPSWGLILVAVLLGAVPSLVARLARRAGMAAVCPPEPVTLALAWAVALVNGRGLGAGAPLVTTVALAVLGVQTGPRLASRVERLTRRRSPVEVTA